MSNIPQIKLYTTTIDCRNPKALAEFYAALLGWDALILGEEYTASAPKGAKQGGYPCLLFQQNDEYTPPTWPDAPGQQQQMAHLDFAVNDLEASVRHALSCGAAEVAEQFSADWRVMIDPEGHPFCLCNMPDMMNSPDFALL